MKRCVYLIPHAGNFTKKDGKSVIGSSTHIGIGIEQLEKYFEVYPLVISRSSETQAKNRSYSAPKSADTSRNKFIGVLRDLKALIKNNIASYKVYQQIKRANPDFIFERSEYLSFAGIIAARMLKIPHYYEANWVHYAGIRQFYSSHFNKIAKWLEELMYSFSTHVFFVGNQHLLLNLRKRNWSTIQNGVGKEVVKKFEYHNNTLQSDVIKICVVASLMKHHRLDILIEALNQLKNSSKIKLYFIGVNFDSFLPQIPSHINYEYLGALPKDKLYDILATMNIAVISGGPFYSSFMKLYDYATVKLAVICPDLSNLIDVFSEKEMLFFKDGSSRDLAKKMEFLIEHPEKIKSYGNNIYQKVKSEFTWEKIFFNISALIKNDLTRQN